MPDADLERTIPAVLNSAFGNAGERCLAGSVAVLVGRSQADALHALGEQARQLVVGPGNQPDTQVGPLIRDEHRKKVLSYIDSGLQEGAKILVDGRHYRDQPGFFVGPTILDNVSPSMGVGKEEIFGPVLSVAHVETLDEAISRANQGSLGNMAAIFTQSGHNARSFRERVEAGMVGVNVGVAQPFGFYPFSGWRNSFFGDLHLHGTDGIEFYTRKKMVISRW